MSLGVDVATVGSYLSLLEKAFVIVRIPPFFSNRRKTLLKKQKIYFLDLGIRNALINNFNPLELRTDVGGLWENFIILERIKVQEYFGLDANNYFFRTYSQVEVDWVEERQGRVEGFEIKWNKGRASAPKAWSEMPRATWRLVNRENHLDFIVPDFPAAAGLTKP